MTASREMTLSEWVNKLPKHHAAVREFASLIAHATETCEWHLDETGTWINGCGTKPHMLSGASPSICGLKFCGYCGKRLTETPRPEPTGEMMGEG